MIERLQIRINGQVQGVGFRPHVYRLAHQLKLSGWIQNNAEGVMIEVQGQLVTNFICQLMANLPELVKVDTIKTKNIPAKACETKFLIHESKGGLVTAKIAPDVGTCAHCLEELFDPQSQFYRYPFLNCTQCGPRLSITRNLPYDRAQTSMFEFPLCSKCKQGYDDPENRRYHAQPTACSRCGPKFSLSIDEIAERISAGEIVAVKGLGGYQIICDATNEQTLLTLRQRKQRNTKPFAVMCLNIKSALNFVKISSEEQEQLTSWMRPIVLLKKSAQHTLPEDVAPGLSHLGVMLPSTPFHYLLFNFFSGHSDGCKWLDQVQSMAFIVTSANPGGKPLITDDETARKELKKIADTVVFYNRKIATRVDDSVICVIDKKPFFIRRARGYVPIGIKLPYAIPSTLALGGYLKNTFCITRNDEAFVSQHIGDLENADTIEFFHETLAHTLKFLDVQPERIAHDLHPDFYTTRFAKEYGLPAFAVQHHHAHLASVAAEHRIERPVLGLALDGYGYGENGGAWGGELFLLKDIHYQRLGHFQPLPLPGGDRAAREPWRMASAVLHLLKRYDDIQARYSNQPNFELFIQMLMNSVNCPLTSSCGRLFDAASALLRIQTISDYEGQAAMRLESLVTHPEILSGGWRIEENRFSLLPTLEHLLACNPTEGANIFHGTLIAGLAEWINQWADEMNIIDIFLSGGCFLNQILAEGLADALIARKLRPFLPYQLPPNDGGISLGQAWIAGRMHLCV